MKESDKGRFFENAPNGAHTHRQTHGHGDSMTESAQWGQFSENLGGGRGGGLTNERPGTDHVISGPMRGLK